MSSPTDENNEVPTAAELGTTDNTHSESDAHTEALEPPFLVGRMEEIGKGGESIVYKVRNPNKTPQLTPTVGHGRQRTR
jgi:hypothetical protein